jgi:LPS-assembly protein
MMLFFCHVRIRAQALTSRIPETAHPSVVPSASGSPSQTSPNRLPVAQPLPQAPEGVPVTLLAAQQTKQGDWYKLRGDVEIDYKSYVLHADQVNYNSTTGDITAFGHLQLTGGPDQENITASHGVMNLDAQTGTFYDVIGSVGVMRSANTTLYTTTNPFTVTGRELIKHGPDDYEISGGTMTSCRLPKPHWQIFAPRIVVKGETARAWHSNFRLFGLPILYLPYVTHAVNTSGRQSGFLTPALETGSAIKGTVIGGAYYWAINRSTDLLLGLQYFSLRGFEQSAQFRYRGFGNDFIIGQYSGLEDRGLAPLYVNQGGQDTLIAGRRDFTDYSRAVINAEYLTSFVYREVFAENFSQAVSSEVKSWGFLTHQIHGTASTGEVERYQNYASTLPGDEVRILHVPTASFEWLDQRITRHGGEFGGLSSMSLLSRSEPYYRSHNVGRFDLFPHIAYPVHADGWNVRPEFGLRETGYSHSQHFGPLPANLPPTPPNQPPGEGATPTPANGGLSRTSMEADVQILPPVLERQFSGPLLTKRFGVALRHTIEPEANYRYVRGVNRFNSIPRFDPVDIYSDTNEMEYGLTQRLFIKRLHPRPCKEPPPTAQPGQTLTITCMPPAHEWLSWFVGQKYFLDPTFGHAVITGRRNIFTSTLDFSGAAYITAPRNISPVVSRLRVDTSANTGVEWDFDYDTKAGRVAASNVFANYRHGQFFSSFGSALLNAVGETPVPPSQPANVVNYNQIQLLLGYGALTRPGLSAAASGGLDLNLHTLEYAVVQTTYNWDCCGFTVEYRRFQLGSIRDESQESFSFTLAGVGAAGNLRRAERLF